MVYSFLQSVVHHGKALRPEFKGGAAVRDRGRMGLTGLHLGSLSAIFSRQPRSNSFCYSVLSPLISISRVFFFLMTLLYMLKGYLIETFQCRVPLLRCLKLITKLTTICTKYVTHGFFYPAYKSLLSKFRSMNMMMYVCISTEVYRKISKTRVVPHLNNCLLLGSSSLWTLSPENCHEQKPF